MSKQFYQMPNIPESGKCDQDFSFALNNDSFTNHFTTSPEDAIESIEKLLRKRHRTISEVINDTGFTKETVINTINKLVDKGHRLIDQLPTDNNPSQLRIF